MAVFGSIGKRISGAIRGLLSVTYVPPLEVVGAQFAELAREIHDLDDPLEKVVRDVMMPSIQANFDAGGRPAWEPLSETTQEIRGDSGPILQRSGDLMGSATSFDLWTIDSAAGEVFVGGIDPFYGGFHQSGTAAMPMREFILIQPEDAEAIAQIFGEHVDDAIKRVKIGI
jgi:phage gpG-like protein